MFDSMSSDITLDFWQTIYKAQRLVENRSVLGEFISTIVDLQVTACDVQHGI